MNIHQSLFFSVSSNYVPRILFLFFFFQAEEKLNSNTHAVRISALLAPKILR